MKVCIYGAGAIGLLIGARLSATGKHDVSAVARGATLAALNDHGLRVDGFAGAISGPVNASADPAALGVQDVVVIAVKAPALADVARGIAPLLGPHTLVVPAMNGVPWWFCQGLSGPAAGLALKSVDPDGSIAAHLPIANVIGCVVHAAASVSEPGKAFNQMGRGLVIGEPRGGISERVAALKAQLDEAGFETTASEMIQRDIWYKLWGNMTTNPISAITGATTDRIIGDELVRELTSNAMLSPAASASASASRSRRRPPSATPSRASWARSRPRCCRTPRPAARSSSTAWSARCASWAGTWAWPRR